MKMLFLIFLFCMLGTNGQEYGSLRGIVKDSVTNKELAFTFVLLLKNNTRVDLTKTDVRGTFELDSIPPGEYVVILKAFGYKDAMHAITVEQYEERFLTVRLADNSDTPHSCLGTCVKSLRGFDPYKIQTRIYSREVIRKMQY